METLGKDLLEQKTRNNALQSQLEAKREEPAGLDEGWHHQGDLAYQPAPDTRIRDYKWNTELLKEAKLTTDPKTYSLLEPMTGHERAKIVTTFPDARKSGCLDVNWGFRQEERGGMNPADTFWMSKIMPDFVKRWKEISSGLLSLAQEAIPDDLREAWGVEGSHLDMSNEEIYAHIMKIWSLHYDLFAQMNTVGRNATLKSTGQRMLPKSEENSFLVPQELRDRLSERAQTEFTLTMSRQGTMENVKRVLAASNRTGTGSGVRRGGFRGGRKRKFSFGPRRPPYNSVSFDTSSGSGGFGGGSGGFGGASSGGFGFGSGPQRGASEVRAVVASGDAGLSGSSGVSAGGANISSLASPTASLTSGGSGKGRTDQDQSGSSQKSTGTLEVEGSFTDRGGGRLDVGQGSNWGPTSDFQQELGQLLLQTASANRCEAFVGETASPTSGSRRVPWQARGGGPGGQGDDRPF